MVRLSAVFIAFCVLLIGACVGIAAFLAVGLSLTQSAVVGFAATTALALYSMVSARVHDHTHVGDQIADISRASADVARQVAELSRRLATVERQASAPPVTSASARPANDPLVSEIGELGALIKQLAETVALHDQKLAGGALPAAAAPAVLANPVAAANDIAPPDTGAFKGKGNDETVTMIRAAVDANRIDLFLQPVVTLPQRKVRYYEALSRLRTEHGTPIMPAEFIPTAEAAGLMPRIDNLVLFRSIQVMRRLLTKNRDVGLFCNLSATTLSDSNIFAEISQFLEANRALAASLMLEMPQSVWRNMGPLETAALAALQDLGFRFSMDHVTDLRIEPRDLVERGIRFIKVPGALLLNRGEGQATDIHAADLSDLLGRFGVSLIAEKIEAEAMVVDLLDYDVRFGQGMLFSPPRPVRADALQSGGDRAEAPERALMGPPAA